MNNIQCVVSLILWFVPLCTGNESVNVSTKNDTSTGNEASVALDRIEQTVVTSILKLVDAKFESISSRLGTLERSMSSLQYYNLRQFRVVSTHMRALDTILQASHSQMSELSLENKETKTSIDILKKEVKNMGKLHNEMFEAIEQNFIHLKRDISTKFETIQGSVDNLKNSTDEQNRSAQTLEIMTKFLDSKSKQSEQYCIEKFGKIEEKMDNFYNFTLYNFENTLQSRENNNSSKEEEKALIQTLTELNDSVMRSIDFYRHTGDLVERIVGATETVADDQTKLRNDVRYFLEVQTNKSCNSQDRSSEEDSQDSNEIPNGVTPEVKCEITLKTLENMLQTAKNGTQMTEIVADMAQTSQYALKSSVIELGLEVNKLKEIQEAMEAENSSTLSATPELFTGLLEYDMEYLTNTSRSIFKIVEAIATNTGWIPYIFQSLLYVENQLNETVTNIRKLIQTPWRYFSQPSPTRTGTSSFHKLSPLDFNLMMRNETQEFLKKFQTVYRTSSKMHRLIPALTKLLGEPEPFITLMDGDYENQGRVEIYRKGRWGTMCGQLGHIEASYICRHLGYLGGVSAGNGFFGAGDGVFWNLNMTCLYTRQCEIAVPVISDTCDHGNDIAVICDHMVKLFQKEENSGNRHAGEVRIYHRGKWIPVCSDGWTAENSRVVCQQLGFEDGRVGHPEILPDLSKQENKLWLHNVQCSGAENRLDACANMVWSFNGCESRTAISLICS